MWRRVHNRNCDRGGKPVRRLSVGREHISPRSIRRTGGAPAGVRCSTSNMSMSLVTAAVMFAPSLTHAQGITSHYLGTPAPALAPQLHLAQQYEPPSLPPEIMVPERRPGGRQRAAPPIAAVPLDPLPPEPTPMAPEAAPRVPLESEPNPLIVWCKEEANAKAPLCRKVGSPKVQR